VAEPASFEPHLVQWQIVRFARDGTYVRHSEGAQTVFGLKRARQVVKALPKGWTIRHTADALLAPPKEK